ncbi:MAG: hypothetical protein WCO63_10145 [Bacteroidota bacterium]
MTNDYTDLIPSFSDFDMQVVPEDKDLDPELQPSESAMRNILQYAAGLFVFKDQDAQSQFLIMN